MVFPNRHGLNGTTERLGIYEADRASPTGMERHTAAHYRTRQTRFNHYAKAVRRVAPMFCYGKRLPPHKVVRKS
ncbi:hypothetical protein Y032_0003g1205 [Ancylostoma ceylanicum]|uniref:Uncharacterized protein n=1 Tax=Ancylostoma ceylanicum TaxID=53326 RepID=A0A016VVV1_9BILA|nr:hypothetical protein Y032_0003g1205 [Ancylostoma ceylanicum]